MPPADRAARRRASGPRAAAPRRVLAGAALLAGGLVLAGAGPAAADPPLELTDEVTDRAGVLDEGDPEVVAALDRLEEDTRYQLFVVLVDTFDDAQDASDWATQTAIASGLGVDDLLLAVAVEDRSYAVSVDDAIELTDDQLHAVAADRIEPRLSDDDWAGAVVAGAEGYRDAALGGSGEGDGGGSGGGALTPLLLGGAVIAVVALVVSLRRRSRAARGGGPGVQGAGASALEQLPTAELVRRAGAALVAVDDALTTSQQELGFAQAQFGREATRRFEEVVAAGRADAARAFALRQQLDDSVPETEQQARAMMLEVLALCERTDAALDAQAEEFDRLRDLQNRAPEVLAETGERAAEVEGRLPVAAVELESLARTYRPEALASVRGNVEQATGLLTAARDAVTRGQEAVATDRAVAVAFARAAEDAVAQAVRLLDGVTHAGRDLAEAGTRIDAALASLGADVADAARLAPTDPAVSAAAQTARGALDAAVRERDTGDPLAALRSLVDAEAALDAALAPVRERTEQAERARTHLATVLGQVTAQVRAVADFVETRRGAVGAEARTRLAEAARLAQQAERTSATDPVAALGEAQRAQQLVLSAQQFAEADVRGWQQQQGPGQGGGFGGGSGSLVLGGILLDQLLRGGGGGWSGGFGGGSFGGGGGRGTSGGFGGGRGGRSGGGRSSGSFGGGGTRGRRGGGGRF